MDELESPGDSCGVCLRCSQELCQAIEQVSERQDLLAARLEKMRILQKDAPRKFHEHFFQELEDLEGQRFKE